MLLHSGMLHYAYRATRPLAVPAVSGASCNPPDAGWMQDNTCPCSLAMLLIQDGVHRAPPSHAHTFMDVEQRHNCVRLVAAWQALAQPIVHLSRCRGHSRGAHALEGACQGVDGLVEEPTVAWALGGRPGAQGCC
jgi:hypothetical protein